MRNNRKNKGRILAGILVVLTLSVNPTITKIFAAGVPAVSEQTQTQDKLESLFKNNVGKYPYEINLLENECLRARLVKILGQSGYKYLCANFETQGPIERQGQLYTCWGMQAHSGNNPGFTICYDPETDNVSVITQRDNGRNTTNKVDQEKPQDVLMMCGM